MNQSRPKLSNLKRQCPQDLAHCEGYVWHLGTKIGKGSFGEVYLGWTDVSDLASLSLETTWHVMGTGRKH